MTDEDKQALELARTAILNGASTRKAGALSGIDPSAISTLIRFDVLPKTNPEQYNKWPDGLEDEVKQLLLVGYTNQQIADATGKTRKSIEHFVNTHPEFKGLRPTGRPKQ